MAGNCTGGALNCSTADWPLDEFFNGSGECKNEYCESDEDYIVRIENHIFPPVYAWFLIGLHGLVFLVGLIGNFLVCLAVYRNHTMRTVTNMFIVNLAIADFLVIFLCLPPTVVWDITETWFMGNTLCKIIPYFQTVSVSVSVLTLTFISVDRWYAICHPLKFRSTIGRAKTAIAAIWIISLLIDIPELVVLETRPRPDLPVNTIYFTQCQPSWDDEMDLYSQLVKFALLYALPLLFISVTYYQIVRVLWRSARMVVLNHPPSNNRSNSAGASVPSGDDPTTTAGSGNASRNHDNNSTSGRLVPHHSSSGGGSNMNAGKDLLTVNSNASIEMQLRSRRKAAKMLVVVVIVFAVCYFPVHLVSILRYAVKLPQNGFTKTAALISHWLCYFNSAINPVIYNFMSEKFRREFGIAMKTCRPGGVKRRGSGRANFSPTQSAVTSLTRTPKMSSAAGSSSAPAGGQTRRRVSLVGNTTADYVNVGSYSSPATMEAGPETVLLCHVTMTSTYTTVTE